MDTFNKSTRLNNDQLLYSTNPKYLTWKGNDYSVLCDMYAAMPKLLVSQEARFPHIETIKEK